MINVLYNEQWINKWKCFYVGIKILTPTKMFLRLPIVLGQGKTGNTSERLLKDHSKVIII